jgi:uncharacterized heparinase superfamily protein
MIFHRLARYWHTLRYLRPVQVYGRLWFRLVRPRADLRPAPALRAGVRGWAMPGLRPRSMLGPAQFRFLQQTHAVDVPGAWNDPRRDKLWLYNLHYFDDLNAVDADTRKHWHRALMDRWIAENPPGQGNGWEPYPTSLRIVNWVKWALRGVADGSNESPPHRGAGVADGGLHHSLAVQTRWLCRRLERHLLGNHLFANAKALVFAGVFFVGPEAQRWLARGQRLLARELREQILPDGGHFERSPMYHALLLEDVLDLLHLAELFPQTLDAGLVSECRERARIMLAWLGAMTHPDGGIGFFNDAAFGIAPSLAQLARHAEMVNVSAVDWHRVEPGAPMNLPDSGYVRMEAGPAVALLDVAEIGPDYLPGHAHADTLSFELSLFGQRVIVNGGTSRYGTGPERLAQRGTAAHSTVELDGLDSSEVWGGFRVARRARPFDVRVERPVSGDDTAVLRVSAAHDGYRRLPGRPVHRRRWELTADRLRVIDRIEGGFDTAVARFHLHPAVEIELDQRDAGTGVLRLATGERCRWRLTGGAVQLLPGLWHPEFGHSLPNHCLVLHLNTDTATLELVWDP